MRKAALIVVCSVLLAFITFWWRSGPVADFSTDSKLTTASSSSVTPTGADNPAQTSVDATAGPTQAASIQSLVLPASLADTEIDGAVELDANGQLLPSLSLRRLFDQVLSSVGELSIEQIRQLLADRLDQLTTADGKRQALAAFERYLRYLQSVDAAAARLNELPFRERLSALSDLRRQLLGSEMADAFFADEESYQRYTLDRRELAEQTGLTAEERTARERELIQQLPESARQPLLQQQQTDADLADAQAIETLSSDASERYRLRRERFGDDAAGRMELLDSERLAWDQRVSAYQQERARWQNSTAAARDAALSDYLTRHFSEAEQRRIRSLQEIGAL